MSAVLPANAFVPFADLLAQLAAAPDLTQALDLTLDTACRLIHADTGTIGLYDAATDTIHTTLTRHAMPAPFVSRFARGDGLAGHIIATGQRYLGRYGDLPRPVVPELREHESLGVPIRGAKELLGYFALSVEPPRHFKPGDVATAELLAGIAAMAIGQTRRREQQLSGNSAVIDERERLARELHDNVTQILASINLLSQTLASTWKRDPAEGEQRAARLHQLAQTAFAEMRMLLRQLAPSESENYHTVSRKSRVLVGLENLRTHALPGALTKLLGNVVPETVAVASSFAAYVPQKLEHEEALYRVCQEALSNSLRHAAAKRVRVEAVVTGEHAVLRVSDDGSGLSTNFRPGIGLSSMRTRIETLRGTFRIGSNNPHGTLIEARLPRSDRELS
jgi:signal transduction histidine kinase